MTSRLADVLDANAAERRRLVALVEGLAQSTADWRPGPDDWSIGEVAHHAILAEESMRTAVERSVARHAAGKRFEPMPDAERTLPFAELVGRRGTLAAGPLKNPEMVTPTRGRALGDLVLELERGAAVSRAAFEPLDPDLLRRLTCPHPLYALLTLYQWVELVGFHDREHADQIARIKRQPGFPG
jgi:hypothetical protein